MLSIFLINQLNHLLFYLLEELPTSNVHTYKQQIIPSKFIAATTPELYSLLL